MRVLTLLTTCFIFLANLLWSIPVPIYAALPSQSTDSAVTPPQPGPDTDGDWLSDADEAKYGSDPAQIDTDGDGVTDFEEIFMLNTDPVMRDPDKDDDGFADTVETALFHTDPAQADPDRDEDGLPDAFELDRGTDPGLADSDDDLLSDWIELLLLKSDPRQADPDTNGNSYPDVIEAWLPLHAREQPCSATVTLQPDSLIVHDPEEADTSSLYGADEALLFYLLLISPEGEYHGLSEQRDSTQSDYVALEGRWQGDLFEGDRVTQFATIGPAIAKCGLLIGLGFQARENDQLWGIQTNMGLHEAYFRLLIDRIPLGWGLTTQGNHHFVGSGIDGSFDYELNYSFGAFPQAPEPSPSTLQPVLSLDEAPAITVQRDMESFPAALKQSLPTVFRSLNQRLAFRHAAAWQIQEPAVDARLPVSYTVTNTPNAFAGKPGQFQITLYDPVYVMETVLLRNYEAANVEEVLTRFVNKIAPQPKGQLVELNFSDRPALLWRVNSPQQARAWVAFRALDQTVNIVHIVTAPGQLAQVEAQFLAFAQTVDFQAPPRQLDRIEQSVNQYLVAAAAGDTEQMQSLICRRNSQTIDLMDLFIGALTGDQPSDAGAVGGGLIAALNQLDVSKVYFETRSIDETAGVATVRVSGTITINGLSGREIKSFRSFNLGRQTYRLKAENGTWRLCD